jgi:hypothetical protein
MAATGSASDGTSSTVETSIISPTVQNFLYSYALVAELEAPGLVLYGARIEYIDSAPTPRSPSSASSLLPGASDPAVLDIQTAEVGQALHTGGEVTLLAPAAEPEGGAGPVPVPEDGLRLLGGGGPTSRWETHAVGGGAFHPEDSSTDYHDFAGGFYLTSAPTSTAMIAPLDLIDNKTIWRVRFTYWDESAHNPYLLLYQVDRQGSGTYIWAYIPLASGGYFEAVSPSLGLAIDNENYAYYFKVILGGSAVSTNLIALEVEVSYVEEVFLPLVLRDDGGLPR